MIKIIRKFKLLKDIINIYIYLIPKVFSSKKIVCIDIYEKGYIQHVFDYLDILKEIPNLEIILATQDCYLSNPEFLSLKFKIISTRVLRFIYGVKLFITPQVHLKKPPNSYSIHIGHNQPIKFLSFPYSLLKNIDEHFVWGPFMYEWIEKMLIEHKVNSKITKIGSPRHDKEIFNNISSIESIKKNKAKKDLVIGYAPSWDEYLSLRTNGIEIMKKISSFKNASVLLRLHPCSLVGRTNINFHLYTGGIDWHKRISSLKLSNLYFQNTNSTIEYLKNIDILITDVSSISYDAFSLNKPIIFFETPKYWESLFASRYVDYAYSKNYIGKLCENKFLNGGRNYGVIVNSVEDLYNNLKKISNGKDKTELLRKSFVKSLFYNKGKSKKFVKDRIIEVLKSI